jgi:hypothetical protein
MCPRILHRPPQHVWTPHHRLRRELKSDHPDDQLINQRLVDAANARAQSSRSGGDESDEDEDGDSGHLGNRKNGNRQSEGIQSGDSALDAVRLEAMLAYGGVFIDAGAACVQPLDPLLERLFLAAGTFPLSMVLVQSDGWHSWPPENSGIFQNHRVFSNHTRLNRLDFSRPIFTPYCLDYRSSLRRRRCAQTRTRSTVSSRTGARPTEACASPTACLASFRTVRPR